MASPSQLSQSAEEEELINEVVDRTPDTSSDLPSSLEKRPFLSSDEEDTGDSDDEESDFEEPIFTPPKKRRVFQWHRIELSGKKAIESFVRGHSWYSPLRNGVVRKCVAHRDCEHYVKLLTNGELYERGAHSTSPNINVSTLRGISPLIIDEVDEKLRGGLKPTFIHNFYKNHDDYKSIAPTVIQISNRKKFLNKSSIKVDTVKQLQSYLLSKNATIS